MNPLLLMLRQLNGDYTVYLKADRHYWQIAPIRWDIIHSERSKYITLFNFGEER